MPLHVRMRLCAVVAESPSLGRRRVRVLRLYSRALARSEGEAPGEARPARSWKRLRSSRGGETPYSVRAAAAALQRKTSARARPLPRPPSAARRARAALGMSVAAAAARKSAAAQRRSPAVLRRVFGHWRTGGAFLKRALGAAGGSGGRGAGLGGGGLDVPHMP